MKKFIGKKFGKLLILSIIKQRRNRAFCLCECGKKKSIDLYAVTFGHTSSCGCGMYQYQKGYRNYKSKGYGEILGRKWSGIRHNAKLRGIDFNISIEDGWNQFLKQNRKCVYTGEKLHFRRTSYDYEYDTASLDRIDSSKGYVKGNIQWIHKNINEIKWNLGESRFIELCKLIVNPIQNEEKCNSCNVVYHKTFKGAGNLGLRQWHRILKNANCRNITIKISIQDAWNQFLKQKGYCALTGLPLYFNSSVDISASLDRIDSSKLYEKNNIQWVHKDINYKLKKHYSEKFLKELCLKIVNNLKVDKLEISDTIVLSDKKIATDISKL